MPLAAAPGRPSFDELTETTGTPLSPEGARMMYSRYHYAAALADGRRVLEIGCGSGQGLRLIGERARFVVGGDIDAALLSRGRRHYRGRFPLAQLSVEALPFRERAFDLILFFEASYYVVDMERGFDEIARVLAPGGVVVFVNANPERPDFVSSPRSHHYHSADEFRSALERRGFIVRTEGAFPIGEEGRAAALIMLARKVLERLQLVPTSLRGRAVLKRLVYRRLITVPPELPAGFAATEERTPLGEGLARGFKVIYVTAEA